MPLTDELRIDTPEQIALELPIAGIGSRFLAIAIDTVLQLCCYIGLLTILVLTSLLSVGSSSSLPSPSGSFVLAVLLFVSFCIYWGYFAVFEIFWKGQTPGKRLAGIRVIKDSGRPADAVSVIVRNLLRVVDFLPSLYAVGIICMMLNRHSRRLGDLAAGTVVVHDKAPARIDAEWIAAAVNAPAAATPQISRLTDAEVVLVETYLQRRTEVDFPARAEVRIQIAKRISERTGLTPDPEQSLDDFLEAVARHARDTARLR